MTITYTQAVLNARLTVVQSAIDAASPVPGRLTLLNSLSQTMAQVVFADPCGTINAGALIFTVPVAAPVVLLDGDIVAATIVDGNGSLVATGLSVGTSTASDIVMASVAVTTGQTITLTYASITGR